MMNMKYLGSDFDNFLTEHGMLMDAELIVILRGFAYLISNLMKEHELTKTEMADRLNISRASLNRLLDPANKSVTLETLENATSVFNK
jgi:predicted transcriptional regulator